MNVMLDLETMGNGANAAIIAIGAIAFDKSGIHEDKFYRQVSLVSSVEVGMECDPSTIMWWMQQSNEARSAFKDNVDALHICQALADFSAWFASIGGQEVWGNGASFDNVILSSAYKKAGLVQPWKFWHDRCYRTIKSMNQSVRLERVGTYHNAVDDAESQAIHLMKILGWVK